MSSERFPSAFKFRLNCIDHYQTNPTTLDVSLPGSDGVADAQNNATVPIIRIFGATETGQKVCAHVHGAFPYLFVEYQGSLEKAKVNAFIQTFAASVNHALAYSYRRNAYQGSLTSYVAHITLVKGVPFYGFHVGYRYYLKVYLRNPAHMTRFADLLHQGAILGHVTQPYESHLQYLLQWMCDYNLYGCAVIACKQVYFRCPVPFNQDVQSEGHRWHDDSVPLEALLDRVDFQRQSHCSLEVDIQLSDILNRHEVDARPIHHDFGERLMSTKAAEKYVPSMAGLWRDETIRRKLRQGVQDASSTPFPPEALISMSADTRDSRSNWVHEDTYNDMVQQIIAEEKFVQDSESSFEHFNLLCKESTNIQTVIESIADLYPTRIASDSFCLTRPEGDDDAAAQDLEHVLPIVDHDSIVKLDNADVPDYFSDDDYVEDDPSSDDGMPVQNVERNSAPGQDDMLLVNTNSQPFSHNMLPPTPTPRKRHLYQTDHPQGPQVGPVKSSAAEVSDIASKSNVRAPVRQLASSQANPSDDPLSRQQDVSSVPRHSNHTEIDRSSSPSKMIHLRTSAQTPMFELSKTKQEVAAHNGSQGWRSELPVPNDINIHGKASLKEQELSRAMGERYALKFHRIAGSVLKLREMPPTSKQAQQSIIRSKQPAIQYQNAFYSNEYDSEKQIVVDKHLGVHQLADDAECDFTRKYRIFNSGRRLAHSPLIDSETAMTHSCRVWKMAQPPPSNARIRRWVLRKTSTKPVNARHGLNGQRQNPIAPISKKSRVKRSLKAKPSSIIETQYMSVMSLELFASTRGNLAPDPAEDEVSCVFWSVQSETGSSEDEYTNGVIVVASGNVSAEQCQKFQGAKVDLEDTELELINRLVDVVRDLDPDILVGYEVHNGSWGYLIERSRLKYEFDLCNELSRVNFGSRGRFGKDADRWGFTHTSTIRITGRHMMNIWRAMRGEMNLLQYTIENVAYRLLQLRIPHYSFRSLTTWYCSGKSCDIARVLNYFLQRTQLNLKIFQGVDMVAKTSEQARLLGVDFFSVISRGSQFKVESLMFRIAKPENYILVSPSRKQVGQQNALECLPLVMEPRSNFYASPVLVLDFQSLYPSIMIAYNYCYSTCLGRIASWRGKNKLGVTDYQRQPGFMELLQDHLSIAPNGLVFVRPHIRKSLLAKMLTEILETRIMVKSGMRQDKKDKILQRLLNNRQLALKLIANVTYGYTSASFSGRLPCAEIADSIVQSGRETLEKAIALIHSVDRWGAEVVYGDTDSLFVHLSGKSRDEAFAIGKEIADTITKGNPRPVKLKFEKVYHPCVLLAKKRYVGFKYEYPAQYVPDFDAKGIETVRRDGTPVEQRIEERALRILFRTQDLSKVRSYFQQQCLKIMTGQINIQDFLFAKEVKLGTYSDNGPGPPGALVATKKMLDDRRSEPQYGERVPYVVIAGAPGARLIDRCVDPDVLLKDDQAELDAEYYISKNIIPPLERIFCLVGANVKGWFDEMPKVQHLRTLQNIDPTLLRTTKVDERTANKRTLETYMREKACLVCSKLFRSDDDSSDEEPMSSDETASLVLTIESESSKYSSDDVEMAQPSQIHHRMLAMRGLVCEECLSSTNTSVFVMQRQLAAAEKEVQAIHKICRDCSNLAPGDEVKCDSKDCPIFYTRVKETNMMRSLTHKLYLLRQKLF